MIQVIEKLKLVALNFEKFLYASNPHVVKSLQSMGFKEDEIRRIELFDWFQGVGLYGYYKMYKWSEDCKYLDIIIKYFDTRIRDGLPEKNINSMAPMLTMLSILEDVDRPDYEELSKEWAQWLYECHPRTENGGLSHLTCEAKNEEELWDDTLFMSVLFLAKAGVYFNEQKYIDEALFQYSLHEYYLSERVSGLWYHGWTFDGQHNFTNALWARGNSWITIFIPEMIELLGQNTHYKQMMHTYEKQCHSLMNLQTENGLWHTLLNESDTYLEASASAGFIYGILKGVNDELLDNIDLSNLHKGIESLINLIDENGIVQQVSAGTAMGKDSLDYYRNIPIEPKPYGQAMTMLALCEYIRRK